MFKTLKWRILKIGVSSVSSLGLVLGSIGLLAGKTNHGYPISGWEHLSLPMGLMVERDWLVGWDSFQSGLTHQAVETEIVVHPVGEEVEQLYPDEPVTRLQLFGILDEGTADVYCFFDTLEKRWFRLSGGQVNSESEVAVLNSSKGPVVEDLRNGNRYLIDREQYQLIQVNKQEHMDEN